MSRVKPRGFFSFVGKGVGWLFLVCLLAYVPVVSSHPGGVDGKGVHRHGPSGTYHFNEGPLAGKSFASREEAYKALDQLRTPQIRLASFNIRIFSNKSRDDEELESIVQLLKGYDIIAIQELRDMKVLDRTVALLNGDTGTEWAYEVSSPVGRGVKERYAFLYRKDRVLVKESGKLVQDSQNVFIREPYYATFKAGLFDFTLITIHTIFKSENAPERKKEFDQLAKVYSRLQDSDPHEQDLMLLGDFNDPPDNARFEAITEIPGMVCLFQPPEKTTIADKSLYDNICFQGDFLSEYSDEKGIDKFDETRYARAYAKAKLEVSDHRPVWAVFRTDRDDD